MNPIFFGLVSIIVGALASSNFVLERIPSAKNFLEKIMPYQAMIGFGVLILSALSIFSIFSVKMMFLSRVIYIGGILATIVVGFLLGFPMIQQWIATDEESKKKVEEIRKKISPYQVLAGLVAIGTGVYLVLIGLF